jgi:transposase InsO family protein
MQYHNLYYRLPKRAISKSLKRALYEAEIDKRAQEREHIVLFYAKHGFKTTQEAYPKIKRSTLLNWQKKYEEFGIMGLIPGNRCPKQKRQSQIPQEIKDYILEYRNKYGNIHKDEIKPHLDEFCKQENIKTISISSIGRIIHALKTKGLLNNAVKYQFNGKTGNIHQVKTKDIVKERRGKYNPEKPGDLVQADSVHLFIDGKKRYLINAIDLCGRLAFSRQYDRLTSQNAQDFFKRLKEFYPFKIKRIQTDNGSEFAGYAHDYLKAHNLTHFFNYPHCPKSNAHIERFNRTIKEQFVYKNEDFLLDCDEANEKICNYLFWYNTKRYHRALNYQTPFFYTQSLLNYKMSNML